MFPGSMETYPLVGIEELDRDHRTLGAVLDRLMAAIKDDDPLLAAAFAEALLVQAAEHCAHEQRLMKEIGYPALARHRRAHDRFLATARDMLAEVRDQGLTAGFLRWVAQSHEWLRSHVVTEDLWLAQAIEKARALQQEKRAVRT
jgi:hemerythrin-like metal-binding protein